jgi:uncharacterized Fe-S cluster-containing radical SAM superfamily protein
MSTQKPLDAQKLGERLREKSVDRATKAIRMTKFPGSDQATDLSLPPNCGGYGRIHHFRLEPDPNWITNPLPTLPACKYLGVPITDVLLAQVFQLAACDFRCWYCFVDFELLSASPKHSDTVTPRELLQKMLDEKVNSQVMDLSGGQPELVPEYVLWFLEARKELGLEQSHFVWADDNLSTDNTWRYLTDKEIEFMVQAPGFARVGCLKGFDAESFTFNTRADGALFDRQIELLGRYVRAGFDQYGYITITTMNTDDLQGKMARLLDAIQNRLHPNFPLRIVPLRIFGFNANANRYNPEAETNQFRALEAWLAEMQRRFSAEALAVPITEVNFTG